MDWNESRESSQDSARHSRNGYGVGRGDNSSRKRKLESNSIDSVRIAFRRAISQSQSSFALQQWRIQYAKTIVPISATLTGATLALAWWLALFQSMVVK